MTQDLVQAKKNDVETEGHMSVVTQQDIERYKRDIAAVHKSRNLVHHYVMNQEVTNTRLLRLW